MTEMRFECKGYKPLLMNRMTEDQKNAFLGPGSKGTSEKKPEDAIYRDPNGAACIPKVQLWSCFVDAAAHLPANSGGIHKLLKAGRGLEIVEEFLTFPADTTWSVEHLHYSTLHGGMRVRLDLPRFDNWSFTATVRFDEHLTKEDVYMLFSRGGQFVGLGFLRAGSKQIDKPGVYGLFEVEHFETMRNV